MPRDRFVGRQHELFDHLVAFGVVNGVGAGDFAVFVQIDFDFGQDQIDRSAIHAAFANRHRQRVHVADQLEHVGGEFLFPGAIVFQVVINFLVSESMIGLDRAAVEFGVDGDAVCGEFDNRRHAVADAMRLQAGQVVGDDFRQHRDHLIGQIDAGRSGVRFGVQVRSIGDKVRDVRDVHAQFPVAIVDSFQRDRIVEVTRGFGVDGDDRGFGEIGSSVDIVFVELLSLFAGVVEDVFGEFLRQSVLIDDALRINTGLSAFAEHFHDHAFAGFVF